MAKFDGVDGESTRGILDLANQGGHNKIEWTYFPGPDKLVKTVLEAHPKGINGILIGLHKLPGYHLTVGKNGSVAILIGLLLPAVQKLRTPQSAEKKMLSAMLAPRGDLGFVLADRSVRIALPSGERLSKASFGKASGSPHDDNWIEVLSTDWGG